MSPLPRVSSLTRERLARELDDRGPQVCRTEFALELEAHNPELLDMAMRCARDVGGLAGSPQVMNGLLIFYRLLSNEAHAAAGMSRESAGVPTLSLLPRVSTDTRAAIVKRIDALGPAEFTRQAVAEIEHGNPELLIMAHNFAEGQRNYVGMMQGFALLYASLLEESLAESGALH
jgi:hypothetical protein